MLYRFGPKLGLQSKYEILHAKAIKENRNFIKIETIYGHFSHREFNTQRRDVTGIIYS